MKKKVNTILYNFCRWLRQKKLRIILFFLFRLFFPPLLGSFCLLIFKNLLTVFIITFISEMISCILFYTVLKTISKIEEEEKGAILQMIEKIKLNY